MLVSDWLETGKFFIKYKAQTFQLNGAFCSIEGDI